MRMCHSQDPKLSRPRHLHGKVSGEPQKDRRANVLDTKIVSKRLSLSCADRRVRVSHCIVKRLLRITKGCGTNKGRAEIARF